MARKDERNPREPLKYDKALNSGRGRGQGSLWSSGQVKTSRENRVTSMGKIPFPKNDGVDAKARFILERGRYSKRAKSDRDLS